MVIPNHHIYPACALHQHGHCQSSSDEKSSNKHCLIMKQKHLIARLMREITSVRQRLALLKSKYNISSLGIGNRLLATKVYLDSGLHPSRWVIPTKHWLAEPLCATPAQHVTDLLLGKGSANYRFVCEDQKISSLP